MFLRCVALHRAHVAIIGGVFSSLQPANLRLKRGITNEAESLHHASYPLIFDPQTAGGLLASVPASKADACIKELVAMGYPKVGTSPHPLADTALAATGHLTLPSPYWHGPRCPAPQRERHAVACAVPAHSSP